MYIFFFGALYVLCFEKQGLWPASLARMLAVTELEGLLLCWGLLCCVVFCGAVSRVAALSAMSSQPLLPAAILQGCRR